MIRLFYLEDGNPKFVEIVKNTDTWLRVYCTRTGVSVQEVMDHARVRFGYISEDTILAYLWKED